MVTDYRDLTISFAVTFVSNDTSEATDIAGKCFNNLLYERIKSAYDRSSNGTGVSWFTLYHTGLVNSVFGFNSLGRQVK